MNIQPSHNISAETALDIFVSGLMMENKYVQGEIKLSSGAEWGKELIIENCIIEHFEAIMVIFELPVKFTNVHFKNCTFMWSYFLKGLEVQNCHFDMILDFSCGGHNQPGYPVIITNNVFMKSVNFFDCQYEWEVKITGNHFETGTNIQSGNQLISFAIPPLITGNTGSINLEFGKL